jgi:poly(3-hydroxybutyrate) depolymerase
MSRRKSVPHFVILSAAAALSFAGCGSAGNVGQAGSGGSRQTGSGGMAGRDSTAGATGAAGTTGSAGGMAGTIGAAGMTGMAGASGGSGDGAAGAGGGGRDGGTAGSGGGGSGVPSGMSAGCGKAPTIPSGIYNGGQLISITAANLQRRYILNVPTNYDNSHPYKLIVAYHQLDGNDKQMFANGYYHLLNLSNNSTIFVAPNGQKNGAPCSGTASNGDPGCGWPNPSSSDIALADAVVAQIEENFCVDTNRIFATGWSYGGSMSYKTACERPLGGAANGFVRAIAVYSGAQLSGTCTPSKPVAYYASHGVSDSVLGYDGGVTLTHNFATANGCTWMEPTKVTTGNHVCTNLMGCMTGYPVEFCSFNGDHTPDPRDPGQLTSWEYQNVWTFFSQF